MVYLDLKSLRQNHNLTQDELCIIMDVSQSTISRMENQLLDVNTVQYGRLCEKFGYEEIDRYVTNKSFE